MTFKPTLQEAKDLKKLEEDVAEAKRVGALRLRREADAMLAMLEKTERENR